MDLLPGIAIVNTPEDLPNTATGSKSMSGLGAGDVARTRHPQGVWICTVPTPGAAVWKVLNVSNGIGGFSGAPCFEDFSTSDYFEESGGTVTIGNESIFAALVRPRPGIAATQPIMGTLDNAGGAGWLMKMDATGSQFAFDFEDGAGALTTATGVYLEPALVRPLWHVMAVRLFDSGGGNEQADVYVNGALVGSNTAINGGLVQAGAYPLRVGFNATFNDIADKLDIAGLAVFTEPSTTVTEDQIAEITSDALRYGHFVDGPVTWDHNWVPARDGSVGYDTLAGSVDLALVGSGIVRAERASAFAG